MVKDCLPTIERHLTASHLPTTWWHAVLERGFLNDSLAARKQVLLFALHLDGPALAAFLGSDACVDALRA